MNYELRIILTPPVNRLAVVGSLHPTLAQLTKNIQAEMPLAAAWFPALHPSELWHKLAVDHIDPNIRP